ncbi:MAG: hypothetical protein JWQ72_2823 [Polaromonas sp.]|nr:hypothetical protein [Polaromonas sp.]
MKKLLIAAALTGLAYTTAFAQAADPKLEWATRVVALQQGPELQRLVAQLADGATQEILQNWGPKLETSVPKAKQEQATGELNAALKSYYDDVSTIINGRVVQVSNSALIPAYMERFSLDELKQIATFFESPVIKKYQAAAPDFGGIFVKELIEATRVEVTARVRVFDDTAAKIVGSAPGARQAPAAAAPADKSRTPAKK